MDQEDDQGGLFLASVEELGLNGLWASVKEVTALTAPALYLHWCSAREPITVGQQMLQHSTGSHSCPADI